MEWSVGGRQSQTICIVRKGSQDNPICSRPACTREKTMYSILRGIAGLNFWQSTKRFEEFVFSTLVRHYKPSQLQDRHVFIRLYKQYVRPHLVFSTQAWSPWTEADKSYLEKNKSKASSENGVWSGAQ